MTVMWQAILLCGLVSITTAQVRFINETTTTGDWHEHEDKDGDADFKFLVEEQAKDDGNPTIQQDIIETYAPLYRYQREYERKCLESDDVCNFRTNFYSTEELSQDRIDRGFQENGAKFLISTSYTNDGNFTFLCQYANRNLNRHFYDTCLVQDGPVTIDYTINGSTRSYNFNYKCVVGRCSKNKLPETVPLLRYWNRAHGDYYYTIYRDDDVLEEDGTDYTLEEEEVCFVFGYDQSFSRGRGC